MTEWVSGRGAAEILGAAGISRTMVCRMLGGGLGGAPIRTPGATLYDAARVRELLKRPSVDADRLPTPTDRALLEVRVAAGSQHGAEYEIGNAGALVRMHARALIERHGFLPVVTSCCGFVLGGGEAVGVDALPDNQARLRVRPPGPWFAAFDGHRMSTGAGNAWRLWLQPEVA